MPRSGSTWIPSSTSSLALDGAEVRGGVGVGFSSVVGFPDEPARRGCDAVPGLAHLAVTASIGGEAWPLCSSHWGERLGRLGRLAAGLVEIPELVLTFVPEPDSIEVVVELEGEPLAFEGSRSGWLYDADRNAVTFVGYRAPPAAVVRVRYRLAE